jgi:hypothetical protein
MSGATNQRCRPDTTSITPTVDPPKRRMYHFSRNDTFPNFVPIKVRRRALRRWHTACQGTGSHLNTDP